MSEAMICPVCGSSNTRLVAPEGWSGAAFCWDCSHDWNIYVAIREKLKEKENQKEAWP